MQELIKYQEKLRAYIFMLCKNYHDTEDILHDTYLKYLQSGKSLSGDELIRYLKVVSRNRFIDLYRKRKNEYIEIKNEAQDVSEYIEVLPINMQELLILRFFYGLTYKKISTIIGVNANTLMTINSRAINKIKTQNKHDIGLQCRKTGIDGDL
jgi:RNA polymerase sigma factor (sigma-70 family)